MFAVRGAPMTDVEEDLQAGYRLAVPNSCSLEPLERVRREDHGAASSV